MSIQLIYPWTLNYYMHEYLISSCVNTVVGINCKIWWQGLQRRPSRRRLWTALCHPVPAGSETHVNTLPHTKSCQSSTWHPSSHMWAVATRAGDAKRYIKRHVECWGDRHLVRGLEAGIPYQREFHTRDDPSPGMTHAGAGAATRGGSETVAHNPTLKGIGMDQV